jgi:hypothetical protein
LDESSLEDIEQKMNDENCYKGDSIISLKDLVVTETERINEAISKERESAMNESERIQELIARTPEFNNLSAEQKEQIEVKLTNERQKIERQNNIAVLKIEKNNISSKIYPALMTNVEQMASNKQEQDEEIVKRIIEQFIFSDFLSKAYPTARIRKQEDLEELLSKLKKDLMSKIDDNTDIYLS